ncbi:MAG: hypothetical protein KME26_24295 [Oscillatoria princeps RMCB-10]|nr:hypothetical protein [Oscillatoria princeps RMCB-10]
MSAASLLRQGTAGWMNAGAGAELCTERRKPALALSECQLGVPVPTSSQLTRAAPSLRQANLNRAGESAGWLGGAAPEGGGSARGEPHWGKALETGFP